VGGKKKKCRRGGESCKKKGGGVWKSRKIRRVVLGGEKMGSEKGGSMAETFRNRRSGKQFEDIKNQEKKGTRKESLGWAQTKPGLRLKGTEDNDGYSGRW